MWFVPCVPALVLCTSAGCMVCPCGGLPCGFPCACLPLCVHGACACAYLVPCCIVPMRHGCMVPLPLFFSAVQMSRGSKSVRTVRRMCHGLPLRVGFSCVVILTTCQATPLVVALPVRTSKRKIKTDSPRAPTCPQSYAYRVPCLRMLARASRLWPAPGAHPAPRPWCVQCETGARACARARHPRACLWACPSVPTGASACARSDCSPRVSNPNLTLVLTLRPTQALAPG